MTKNVLKTVYSATGTLSFNEKRCDLDFEIEKVRIRLNKYSHVIPSVVLRLQDRRNFVLVYRAVLEFGLLPIVMSSGGEKDLCESFGAYLLIDDSCEVEMQFKIENLSAPSPFPREAAVVLQTSGSTGESKYVVWSKAGLKYQLDSTFRRLGYRLDDVLVVSVPPWSAYGLSLLHFWLERSISICFTDYVYPREIVSLLESSGAASWDASPQIYRLLHRFLSRKGGRGKLESLNRVRLWCSGGEVLPKSLAEKWLSLTGHPILDGYGLSEAGPNVSISGPTSVKLGSVGKALSGTELSIAADGEIWVRGPGIALGYYHPGSRRIGPVTNPEGWLSTGDLGRIDEQGYLFIEGRKKNLVIANGRNISPIRVEAALKSHPAVEDCVVFGVKKAGESGEALVAIYSGEAAAEKELKQHLAACLEPEHVPRMIVYLRQIPYNQNGKLDRQRISKLFSLRFESNDA